MDPNQRTLPNHVKKMVEFLWELTCFLYLFVATMAIGSMFPTKMVKVIPFQSQLLKESKSIGALSWLLQLHKKVFKNHSQLLINTDGSNLSNVMQLPFHTFTSSYYTHTNHVKNPCQYYTGNLVTSPTSPKELSANIPIGSGIKPLNIQPFFPNKTQHLSSYERVLSKLKPHFHRFTRNHIFCTNMRLF